MRLESMSGKYTYKRNTATSSQAASLERMHASTRMHTHTHAIQHMLALSLARTHARTLAPLLRTRGSYWPVYQSAEISRSPASSLPCIRPAGSSGASDIISDRLVDYAGAWAFFSLSLGIFLLPFSSLLCNVFAGDGSKWWTWSLVLLCASLTLITVGTSLLVVWCLKGGPTKPSKGDDLPLKHMCEASESGTSQVTMITCSTNGVDSRPVSERP
ncbi:hypothetical protein LSAT2_023436 [Lamellibrachia satsuma]|nr:hypothetical protein LSAT2_023436 [Lamellibrachia satsuma]